MKMRFPKIWKTIRKTPEQNKNQNVTLDIIMNSMHLVYVNYKTHYHYVIRSTPYKNLILTIL
jgi:hypothetical protein